MSNQIVKRLLLGLTFVLIGVGVACASVYDDAFWMMQPQDLNLNGRLDAGEIVNALKGGDLGDASHTTQAVWGFDSNRTISPQVVNSAWVTSFTAYVLGLFDYPVEVSGTPQYFNGNAELGAGVASLHDPASDGFSVVTRCKCLDVASNTRWLFSLGKYSETGFSIGFIDKKVRVWGCGGNRGSNLASNGGIISLPVESDTWIDLGISLHVRTDLISGVATSYTTQSILVSYLDAGGERKTYSDTCEFVGNMVPNRQNFFIGVQSAATAASSTKPDNKRFRGYVQQLAFWDRALSEDELSEAFKVAFPTCRQVGVENGSGAEFSDGASTAFRLDGVWNAVPKTIASGDVWTISFGLDAASYSAGRDFLLMPVVGDGTFAGALNGEQAVASKMDEAGCVRLHFPPRQFKPGDNVLVLTRTDQGNPLTVDAIRMIEARDVIRRTFSESVELTEPISLEGEDTFYEYDVPEGVAVTISGTICGEGGLVKTGAGNLILKASNSYSGGTEVRGGVLETGASSSACGSGEVVVQTDGRQLSQLSVTGAMANDIRVMGSSGPEFPALHLGKGGECEVVLSGSLAADGDLAVTTAWDDDASKGDQQLVTVNGVVSVAGTLSLAPHCRVKFDQCISCETLNLHWRANSATSDGGNPGSVLLPSFGDKDSGVACTMHRVLIDQTRIVQNGHNVFGGRSSAPFGFAEVEWTGLHKTGGSIDANGFKLGFGTVVTPPTTADDEMSMRIIQGGSAYVNFYDTPTCDLYLRFEGGMSASFNTPNSTITLKDRRQGIAGALIASASQVVVTGGTRFLQNVPCYVGSANSSLSFTELTDPTALRALRQFVFNHNNTRILFDRQSFLTLANDYTVDLSTPSGRTGLGLVLPAGCVWKISQFVVGGVVQPSGRYSGTVGNITISEDVEILTTGPATNLGPVTWNGTTWQKEDGQPADLSLNGYVATFAADEDTIANLPRGANFYGLDFNSVGSGFVRLIGSDSLVLWNGGISFADDAAAGTRVSIDLPVQMKNADVAVKIPSNGTFTVSSGLSGDVAVTLDGSAAVDCVHKIADEAFSDGGVFNLRGENAFSRGLTVSGAVLHISGGLGSIGDTSVFTIYQNANGVAGNAVFEGLDCWKEVSVKGAGANDLTAETAWMMAAGTTNEFHGKVRHNVSSGLHLKRDSVTIFEGGFEAEHTVAIIDWDADATATKLRFDGPVNAAYSTSRDRDFLLASQGRNFNVAFNAAEGVVGGLLMTGRDMSVDVNISYPFSVLRQITKVGDETGEVTVRLNGTKLATTSIRVNAQGEIVGTRGGAALEITGATPYTSSGYEDSAVRGRISGCADVVMRAPSNKLQFIGAANDSVGTLRLESGTVSFDRTSSWAGDIRVLAGTLELAGRLRLAPGRHVYVGEGDVPVEDGLYGAIGSGMQHEVSWIVGTGRLRIGEIGTAILVR